MIERRLFLRYCSGAATTALLTGCGGSGGDTTGGGVQVIAAPSPSPTPSPTPTPSVVEVLPPATPASGDPIDVAEADIAAVFDGVFAGFSVNDQFDDVRTVASADAFVAIFTSLRQTLSVSTLLARRMKIVCDWDGVSMLASGAGTRLMITNPQGLLTGHIEGGGGILVVAAAGRRPAFGNQVELLGLRGVHFDGIDFFRQRIGSESVDSTYGVNLITNSSYPARVIAHFTNCRFGARHVDATIAPANWICGINSSGTPDSVGLVSCTFNGHSAVARISAKKLRVDRCDVIASLGDIFPIYGHTMDTGYYAVAWISRVTVRASMAGIDQRNSHRDVVQTCTPADIHLGYRLLLTDIVAHQEHRYAGDPGMGGGSQGFFNRGYTGNTFDNQYVVRRCTILVSAPHGFAYYATKPTRKSYVDQCTFMRCASVPSGFAGDANPAQDWAVGFTYGEQAQASEPMLFVTRSFGADMRTIRDGTSDVSITEVDPRASGIPSAEWPETLFTGRDFTRGGAAGNYVANKFGYVLPSETTSRAAFLADVWANFEPKGGFAGIGAPDPRSM